MKRTAVLLALAPLACDRVLPQVGHVRLFIATDAPVPDERNDGGAIPSEPPALFDRVRVEVFQPDAGAPCESECRRELVLDAQRLREGMSFTIRTRPETEGYRVRVRMFRARSSLASAGASEADRACEDLASCVEVVGALPPVPAEGVVEATVRIPSEGVGRSQGSVAEPVALLEGRPDPAWTGSWAGAQRVGCADEPRPGEVCVPGGAFWMGDPAAPTAPRALDGQRQRLVVVSPFFLDATEVTVRAFRAIDGGWSATDWHGGEDGVNNDYCTLTTGEPRKPRFGAVDPDDLAINCVSWCDARAYCESRGADLPTEAQYEYAQGALASRTYPWGDDEPDCDTAVWGRSGRGDFVAFAGRCARDVLGGPLAPRSRERDRVDVPSGSVSDLAGNLAEWTRDTWSRSDGPYWRAPYVRDPYFHGPRSGCDEDGKYQAHVIRGGSWATPSAWMRSPVRQTLSNLEFRHYDALIGFRCARPARPRE